jgi:hypothetical protein
MANKLTVAEIKANIVTIAKNAAELNILVHDTAMGILHHAKAHGDATLAQALVMCLPSTLRRTQLIGWFSDYSPLALKNDADWPGKVIKKAKIGERGYLIADADKKPWYVRADENKETDAKTYTLDQLIAIVRGYSKKINKKLEDKEIDGNDVIAARMFASYLADMAIPDFKILAYKAKEAAELAANANKEGETLIQPETDQTDAKAEAA